MKSNHDLWKYVYIFLLSAAFLFIIFIVLKASNESL